MSVECLLASGEGANNRVIAAALIWLYEHGGGSIVAPSKIIMGRILGVITEAELEKSKDRLARHGIELEWGQHGVPCEAMNIVAVYMGKEIEPFIRKGVTERILFVPWADDEVAWIKDAYRPIVMEVDGNDMLAPAKQQPEYQSIKSLIPEKQDKVLAILARMAAGYDNNLQWRERERFKAELMKCRSAWMRIDSRLILRRCAELGMSAEDSSEISKMVKQLQGGHRFRPKKGYEDGWRY